MLESRQVTKFFGEIKAVDSVSAAVEDGSVYGLIGTNGAGKSTFLRMAAGILKPDSGNVFIDGQQVFENISVKQKVFYIPDEPYFLPNAALEDMEVYYSAVYKQFDRARFREMSEQFGLVRRRKVATFSKGMKKQLAILLGLCSGVSYLLCDETFDGLDPVMRQAVKSIFAKEVEERKLTPIIASHNLRELEDICDHVGLLHRGGILFSKDLYEMKLDIHKVQCVLQENSSDIEELCKKLDVMKKEQRGRLYTLTLRGNKEEIMRIFEEAEPVFYEVVPLSLEEIFISETEVVGYDIKSLIF